MSSFFLYVRRSIFRLPLIMAFSCVLEITFHLLEGTRPNYEFPWGHYRATIAIFGVIFFLIAYVTRIPAEAGLSNPGPQTETPRKKPVKPVRPRKKSSPQK